MNAEFEFRAAVWACYLVLSLCLFHSEHGLAAGAGSENMRFPEFYSAAEQIEFFAYSARHFKPFRIFRAALFDVF